MKKMIFGLALLASISSFATTTNILDLDSNKLTITILKNIQKNKPELLIATPPCQGLSSLGKNKNQKEYILDGLLTALAKPLLRALTDSIVQWIRSGFQGQPLFITNFETHLADAADQATGRFMKEYLSPESYNLLCSPWRFQTQLLLKRVSSTRLQRQRCTLNTVLANAENGITFGAALRRGSWEDWMGVALNPQNNPHGALLSQYNKLLGEQNKAKDKAKTESVSNQGFLSMRECVEYYPLTAEESFYLAEPVCKRYENSSPGKWIQTQLSSATGIDFHEIALADEINEIIGALVSSMLSTVLQGGVLRLR